MVTISASMPPPRTDETARIAVERVGRGEREPHLWVSIADRCGDALIEGFARVAAAYYGGRVD